MAVVSVYFRAKQASTRDALTRKGIGQKDTEMIAPHVRVLLKYKVTYILLKIKYFL